MKLRVISAIWAALFVGACSQESSLPEVATTKKSQPVCETLQDLFTWTRSYFDQSERGRYSCRFMKEGLKMTVLKSAPHPDLPSIEVALVRVQLPSGKELDGFTQLVRDKK